MKFEYKKIGVVLLIFFLVYAVIKIFTTDEHSGKALGTFVKAILMLLKAL